jgi:hypothetical protein
MVSALGIYHSVREQINLNFSEVSYFTSRGSIFILLKLENATRENTSCEKKWLSY